jgi:hypothetical protein
MPAPVGTSVDRIIRDRGDTREEIVTAYRIRMQASCHREQAEEIVEYLRVIPGFYSAERLQKPDGERARLDFSIVIREEVQEGSLLSTAEERVGQYLWQRPDLQPVDVRALAEERLPEAEEPQISPEHIPPRRSL